MSELTENEVDVLLSMEDYDGWSRPMDVGGRDGSHHSTTLKRLARKKLVLMKSRSGRIVEDVDAPRRGGGSYVYQITAAGNAAIKAHRLAERSGT